MVTNVDVGTINTNFPSAKCVSHPQGDSDGPSCGGLLPYKSTYGQFVTPLFPSRSLLSIIQVNMRLVHNFHNGSEQLDNTCFVCYSN